MPKVSEGHREAVRQRLVDAAHRMLLRKGDQLTTREILAEAGLSAGTLYNYFTSKAELLEAVAERTLAEHALRLSKAAEDGERGTGGAVLDLLTEQLARGPEPGSALLAQLRGRVTEDPEVKAAVTRYNRSVVTAFRPIVEAAAADGSLRSGIDHGALIELIDIVSDGMSRRAAMDSFATDPVALATTCVQVLAHGVLEGTSAEGPARTEAG